MKVLVPTVAVLLLASAASAQTAPQTPPERSAADLTRDLNSRPPTIEEYLARPAQPADEAAPATPARPAVPVPAPAAAAPAPSRSPATSGPSAGRAPAPAPEAETSPNADEVVEAAPAAPAAPGVTVLDAAARAALPFTVELPAGFQIVTGRPGPDFRIYTIRRGDRSFVMVYAGPASQFPIYSGETVEAGGRTSVVVTEQGRRHAVEHLFQRPDAPREIHVWTMTLEGADRALAEQIAQSVDLR